MKASTPVRALMRRLDGCVRTNTARDVAEMMEEMGLRFMPVVADLDSRRVTGVVSRHGLAQAMTASGEADARIIDAPLLRLPVVEPDLPKGRLEERAGLAAAYVVAEGERLMGLYDPGAEWRYQP